MEGLCPAQCVPLPLRAVPLAPQQGAQVCLVLLRLVHVRLLVGDTCTFGIRVVIRFVHPAISTGRDGVARGPFVLVA